MRLFWRWPREAGGKEQRRRDRVEEGLPPGCTVGEAGGDSGVLVWWDPVPWVQKVFPDMSLGEQKASALMKGCPGDARQP